VLAGLEALPATARAKGERASRRFIEFFTTSIRNRSTRVRLCTSGQTVLRGVIVLEDASAGQIVEELSDRSSCGCGST
jgi:hypothetical protein